jgi:hypothetical protein
MPADDRLGVTTNSEPQLSQDDPKQLIERAESWARPLGMESQQSLPRSHVLQEEFFSGAKDRDDPAK